MGTKGSTVLEPLWRGLFPPADHSGVSGSATCALPPRYEAVKSAREFTRETLGRWCMEGEFDTVALVVSELVTNALRHGLPEQQPVSAARAPEATLRSPVRLDLMRWAARLVCAVRDPSGRPPEPARRCATLDPPASLDPVAALESPAPDSPAGTGDLTADSAATGSVSCADLADFAAESGRGLRLVESFSDGWGWHPLTGTVRGKVVWALFHVDAG
jgi:hypothetical protein